MGSNKPRINLGEIRALRSGQLSKNCVDKKSLEGDAFCENGEPVANGLLEELDDSESLKLSSRLLEAFSK